MASAMKTLRQRLVWGVAWAARSVWWPLAGKAGALVVAFFALAHVGAGAAVRIHEGALNSPPATARVDLGSPPSAAPPLAVSASAKASAAPSASCHPAPSAAFTEDGRLILNVASAADFQKLPRIGAKRARAIVALREKLKRFRHLRDLARIRGIGYKMLKTLEPLVVVDPPKKEDE
jgi:competence protein ComEA